MIKDESNVKKAYTIKEAAKKIGIESHVLRYWEEELDISIERNELGHRYYTEEDVKLFSEVKKLKDGGIALKAIRKILKEAKGEKEDESEEVKSIREAAGTIAGAVCEELPEDADKEDTDSDDTGTEGDNNRKRENGENSICHVSVPEENQIDPGNGRVVDFKMAQLQAILNRAVANALTETLTDTMKTVVTETVVKQVDMLLREQEEREEERFRKLDEQLRAFQKGKKRRLFKK